jgi:hypothetical protein
MSSEQPKRRGRPPRDPSTTSESRAGFHLGLRLNEHRRSQLTALVEAANERARGASLPANVTPSGLVTFWIMERLDAETAKLGKRR